MGDSCSVCGRGYVYGPGGRSHSDCDDTQQRRAEFDVALKWLTDDKNKTGPMPEILKKLQERIMNTDKPALGRTVIYTSKIDNGPGNEVQSPAVIILTRADVKQEVLDRWGPEPTEVGPSPVDGQTHVTAAKPGSFVVPQSDEHVSLLVHGLGRDYREHNVARGFGLGTWHFYNDTEVEGV